MFGINGKISYFQSRVLQFIIAENIFDFEKKKIRIFVYL